MRAEDYIQELHKCIDMMCKISDRADEDMELEFGEWRRMDRRLVEARNSLWEYIRDYRERNSATIETYEGETIEDAISKLNER